MSSLVVIISRWSLDQDNGCLRWLSDDWTILIWFSSGRCPGVVRLFVVIERIPFVMKKKPSRWDTYRDKITVHCHTFIILVDRSITYWFIARVTLILYMSTVMGSRILSSKFHCHIIQNNTTVPETRYILSYQVRINTTGLVRIIWSSQ